MVCAETVPSGETFPSGLFVLVIFGATAGFLCAAFGLWVFGGNRKPAMGGEQMAFQAEEAQLAPGLGLQDEDMTLIVRLLLDQSRQKDKTIKRLKRKLNGNSSESE